jgi:hypothetical protein
MAKKGTIKLGSISKEQLRKADKKGSRDASLENSTGWVSTHKVHKGKKDKENHRKRKHKGSDF